MTFILYVIKKNKELIKCNVISNLDKFSAFYIYMELERNIIIYNEEVESCLVKDCEKYIKHQKIDDVGSWESPLYVVLRLKQKGIIKEIKKYQQFANKNYFFNFVCFPNKFDYNNFDVSWYQ